MGDDVLVQLALTQKEAARLRKLLGVCKQGDGLDRVRELLFVGNGVDPPDYLFPGYKFKGEGHDT